MNLEQIKLAYGIAGSVNSNSYMGAVLIADYKGFPVEFRYTDPIVPTKIQQVLYGDGMEKYVKLDVIMDSLIKILSNKIDLMLVEDEELLEYKSDNIAIVRVSSTKSPPLNKQGDLSKVKNSEFLLQTLHSNNPVRLQFGFNFECQGEQFDSIIKILTEAGRFIDIEEPLTRANKTLELICNQEV